MASNTILVATPVVSINDVIIDEVVRAGFTTESATDHAEICERLQFGFHPCAIIIGHSFTLGATEGESIIRHYREHTPEGAILVYTDPSNFSRLREQKNNYPGEFTIALNHAPDDDGPSPLEILRDFLRRLKP